MRRGLLILFLLVCATASAAFAQTVVKTFTLSKDFSDVSGTPRVVRNAFEHNWAVAWRQQGAPSKIFGRIIESDGAVKSRKTLVKKVSSAEQSFDIFPDSVNYTYLLVYETSQSDLTTQLFNGTLAKVGSASVIESGFTGTMPRLAFQGGDNPRFVLFWLSENRTVLKTMFLNVDGTSAEAARVLRQAPAGSTFESLNASTNQDTGNILLTFLQSEAGTGQLLGLHVKPDGTLLKTKALPVTPAVNGLNTFADASFADNGSGFELWRDGDKINRRKISKKGGLASAIKSLPGEADANSAQTSILLDQRNNLFVGVWTQANKVRAIGLNSATGAVVEDSFDVAISTLTNSRNASTSYDGQLGNIVAVWEDSDEPLTASSAQAKFRIRGALFFIESETSQEGISIGDNFFNAGNGNGNLTVTAGDTVKWTNDGSNPHTVTSGNESDPGKVFDSNNLNRGDTFSFRFTEVGSFPYFCNIHGSATMSGTITVNSSGGEPPPRY